MCQNWPQKPRSAARGSRPAASVLVKAANMAGLTAATHQPGLPESPETRPVLLHRSCIRRRARATRRKAGGEGSGDRLPRAQAEVWVGFSPRGSARGGELLLPWIEQALCHAKRVECE